MRISKFAISTLAFCIVLGSAASAAVFPSMPKAPHATRTTHAPTLGAKHHKHK